MISHTQIHRHTNTYSTSTHTAYQHINKHINTSAHQHIQQTNTSTNTSTHQQTHQHINKHIQHINTYSITTHQQTHQHISTSTHTAHQLINKHINTSTNTYSTSIHQHIKHTNTSTYQQTHQHINKHMNTWTSSLGDPFDNQINFRTKFSILPIMEKLFDQIVFDDLVKEFIHYQLAKKKVSNYPHTPQIGEITTSLQLVFTGGTTNSQLQSLKKSLFQPTKKRISPVHQPKQLAWRSPFRKTRCPWQHKFNKCSNTWEMVV